MEPVIRHQWKISPEEAERLQREMALRVEQEDRMDPVRYAAGVDVAYSKYSDRLIAAVVVLDVETLSVADSAVVEAEAGFPYIPGLFSFRELPPVIEAFRQLTVNPQLVICDGQGLAHPRRFGLACHLGVLFDLPAIGCGKTRLLGDFADPSSARGAAAPLLHEGQIIGCALRTQTNIKPVFVSVGHRISLPAACGWVLKLAPQYRLPETTRQADHLVNQVLRHGR